MPELQNGPGISPGATMNGCLVRAAVRALRSVFSFCPCAGCPGFDLPALVAPAGELAPRADSVAGARSVPSGWPVPRAFRARSVAPEVPPADVRVAESDCY